MGTYFFDECSSAHGTSFESFHDRALIGMDFRDIKSGGSISYLVSAFARS
jgi:hypothetical protein